MGGIENGMNTVKMCIRDSAGIIVFVEVKTRRTLRYGTPQEAVTSSKQINLCLLYTSCLTRCAR